MTGKWPLRVVCLLLLVCASASSGGAGWKWSLGSQLLHPFNATETESDFDDSEASLSIDLTTSGTAESAQQMLAGLAKWKDEVASINFTAPWEALREMADTFNASQIVVRISEAWSRVNQTWAESTGRKTNAVVHYTSKLSLSGLHRILRAQSQAARMGYHYHLIYSTLGNGDHVQADLSTLKQMMQPHCFTVLQREDLQHLLERCLSPHLHIDNHTLDRLACQSDYLLLAWLLKAGSIKRNVGQAFSSSDCSPWRKWFPKPVALPDNACPPTLYEFQLPARYFWMLPLEQDWVGDLPTLLEQLDEEYAGDSDVVVACGRGHSSCFGRLDRSRQSPAWLGLLQSPLRHEEEAVINVKSPAMARYSSRLVQQWVETNATTHPVDVQCSLIDHALVHCRTRVSSAANVFNRPLAFYDSTRYARSRGLLRRGFRPFSVGKEGGREESALLESDDQHRSHGNL